jgi:hypothetical protein
MNIIERVKNILLSPKTEWAKINTEPGTLNTLIPSYTLIVTAVGAAGLFLGIAFLGYGTAIKAGLIFAIAYILYVIITVVAATYIADGLAPQLGAEKSINKSAQWVVYGLTPLCLSLILGLIPGEDTRWFIMIAGFGYSFFLLYSGASIIKKTAEDKSLAYAAVVTGISLVLFLILERIGAKIIVKVLY